jgi:hypothetical protein
MSESPAPHPGPRPLEIEFPFAAAHAVIAAIDAELDDLAGCARDHEDGAGLALADAVGQTTNAFWQRMGSRLQDLARRRVELEEQRSQVEALIGRARALEQSRSSEIAAWERRLREHRDGFRSSGDGRHPTSTVPGGPFTDPSLTLLPAIAHSAVAAATQPRLLARLVALGELDESGLDIAYAEAAAHAATDAAYAHVLAKEHANLGLIESEAQARFVVELRAAGRLLGTAEAAHGTVGALQGRASHAASELRSGATFDARSQASATLRDTPPWLRSTVGSPLYRGAGRALPAAGFGIDLLRHHQLGRDPAESLTRASAGVAGGLGGAKLAATYTAPALALGPKGWVAYGGVLVVAGGAGAIGGEAVVARFFEDDPADHLWVESSWVDDLPAPGPKSQSK